MKVTKSYIKQLVKEELTKVLYENKALLNEISTELGELSFPQFSSFFEDSPNSFLSFIYKASDEYLKDQAKYDNFSQADVMVIRRKFMPVYREAVKSSWSAYPSNRKEPQEQSITTRRDDGSELASGPGEAVSNQFSKALRQAQSSDRTEFNRMDAFKYFQMLMQNQID